MNRPTTTIRLLAATLLLLVGCGDPAPEPAAQLPAQAQKLSPASPRSIQPPPVIRDRLRTEPVATRPVPDVVTAPGEVALDLKQVAKITSRIEGQIEQIHVQLGDRVRKGQRLAAIGSLQLDQLIEEYLVAKAQADVAENSFRRTETLRANDIVPEKKLIEDKGRYLETSARYQHIREKLLNMGLSNTELTELERGRHDESHRYTLTAPIGGTVVMQNAVRGQGVAPGNALFEIVDTSRVWVFANLSIEQARKFKEGDRGTILAKGADAITAPLTYLAPIADETTRTIQARFEVDNALGQLKPREYVEVTLTLPGAPVLAVPASALTAIGTLRGIFIEQDSTYRFVPVELGRENGDWVEVKHGVNEQDRVVTAGVFDLKNILLKEQIGTGD
ncbi:MAG: Cobalt/zinc/cadmium efflux RND transporter, membrane fusion protein, CzcB family [Nitrospira sp.]|nr:MAG: Cobalt/zinc/cadmium efflux RND transporter, membrane fusion protein, CzcB family [Nitrospira sp.]